MAQRREQHTLWGNKMQCSCLERRRFLCVASYGKGGIEERYAGRGQALSIWPSMRQTIKLTWLVLGGDPAARSHRVEQFTAL
jgi:hypothetical protein